MALENEGSNPSTHPINLAPIAQRTEHRSSEPRVVGSNPSRRASDSSPLADILCLSQPRFKEFVKAPTNPLTVRLLKLWGGIVRTMVRPTVGKICFCQLANFLGKY